MVIPIDLSSLKDVELVVEALQQFVKRKIPVRFGLVPVTHTPATIDQAKIVYHLQETYGLSSIFAYLEAVSQKTGTCMQPLESFGILTSLPVCQVQEQSRRSDQEFRYRNQGPQVTQR